MCCTVANTAGKVLWVSGLSSTTRAADLKAVFSKFGKVMGAKIVTSARSPGSKCYGLITMATVEDANKSIQHLHRTELHGKMITVEKVCVISFRDSSSLDCARFNFNVSCYLNSLRPRAFHRHPKIKRRRTRLKNLLMLEKRRRHPKRMLRRLHPLPRLRQMVALNHQLQVRIKRM